MRGFKNIAYTCPLWVCLFFHSINCRNYVALFARPLAGRQCTISTVSKSIIYLAVGQSATSEGGLFASSNRTYIDRRLMALKNSADQELRPPFSEKVPSGDLFDPNESGHICALTSDQNAHLELGAFHISRSDNQVFGPHLCNISSE